MRFSLQTPLRVLPTLMLGLALTSQAVHAQDVAQGMATISPTPADRVRQTLIAAGVTTCVDTIYRAAQFLFGDGEGNYTLQPVGPEANRWPLILTIESVHPVAEGANRLSILTIAPAGSCSGSYQQIISWTRSCAELRATVFAGFAGDKPLYTTVRQSELTPGIQLYLMPSGTGCVSIKKELIR